MTRPATAISIDAVSAAVPRVSLIIRLTNVSSALAEGSSPLRYRSRPTMSAAIVTSTTAALCQGQREKAARETHEVVTESERSSGHLGDTAAPP